MKSYPKGVFEILSLFVLFNFGVVQPLFDLLSRNSEFFVAKHSKPLEIVLLAVFLSIGIPGILAVIELLSGLIHPYLRRAVHGFLSVLLTAATLMPALKNLDILPGTVLIGIAILGGLLLLVMVSRSHPVQLLVNYLSLSILIIPVMFLMNQNITKVLHSQGSALPQVSKVSATTPVIVLVFDEFPLVSLLNEKGAIDPVRYPNFHKLMEDSIWFRNATTVADGTPEAVSAILTGKYPDPSRLAIVKDYPHNLFTLLAGSYGLVVVEPITELCPRAFNVSGSVKSGINRQMQSTLEDLSAVYLNVIVPADFSGSLPSIGLSWGNFWSQQQSGNVLNRPDPYSQRMEQFQDFLSSIKPANKPGLFFLHTVLPHIPWEYLPSGKRYDYRSLGPMGAEGVSVQEEVWTKDELLVARGYQRHLLQVGFVDRMLGKLIERLKHVGLYNQALVVVTADHGAGFVPGNPYRTLNKMNFGDILSVPLLIKLPESSQKGIFEREVESIDILPTIADALGIRTNWQMDGFSALRDPAIPRTKKKAFSNVGTRGARTWVEFDPQTVDTQASVRRKQELFGSGNTDGLDRIELFTATIGAHLDTSDASKPSSFRVEIRNAESWNSVDLSSDFIPAFITGRILFKDPVDKPVLLGVLVNGVLQGVTSSYLPDKNVQGWIKTLWLRSAIDGGQASSLEGIHGFGIIVPESSLRQGKNDVQIIDFQKMGKK